MNMTDSIALFAALPLAGGVLYGLHRWRRRAPKLQLVYFPVRARAETSRLILEYGSVEYTDVSPRDYFGNDWKAGGKALAPMGKLPLLIVNDDHVIFQSNSIVRYCASLVPSLEPQSRLERALCDAIFEASMELCNAGTLLNVNPVVNVWKGVDFDSKKQSYLEQAPEKIACLEAHHPGRGAFYFGDTPRYCDFGVYHVLSNSLLLEPTILDAHPKLRALMAATEALPGVREYLRARPTPVGIGVAPRLEPMLVGSRTRDQPLL